MPLASAARYLAPGVHTTRRWQEDNDIQKRTAQVSVGHQNVLCRSGGHQQQVKVRFV
jgi:hypothetical protein